MARRRTRTKPSLSQSLVKETPIFAAMQGPKKIREIGRGWGIARTSAGMSTANRIEAMKRSIESMDASWREQDKVGKELILAPRS